MQIGDPGWKKFGSGIRYRKKSDPGSGINIPDPQHCEVHDKYLESKYFSLQVATEDTKVIEALDLFVRDGISGMRVPSHKYIIRHRNTEIRMRSSLIADEI
jgi:hypothetical protein